MAKPPAQTIHVSLPAKMVEEVDRYAAEDAADGERPNRSRLFQRMLRAERQRRRAERSGSAAEPPT